MKTMICCLLSLLSQLAFGQSLPADIVQAPHLKWKFQTRGPIVAAPVTSGETAFVGSADSTLYAIDIETGKTRWRFRTGGPIRSSACLDGERVLVLGGDGVLYALQKQSGKELWRFRTAGEKIYSLYGYADYYHSTPVLHESVVYFGSGDGQVYALRSTDGHELWRFATGDVVHASPVWYQGKLYVGSFDGYVYALDAGTGRLVWKFKSVGHRFFPKGEMQGSPIAGQGLIFVGGRDYNLYALDAEKGYCHWNKSFPKGWSLALSLCDSVLYAGTSDDDVMVAFDAASGQEHWRSNVQFNIFSPAVCTPGLLYFGTLHGKLLALDRPSGAIRWSFHTDGYRTHQARFFPDEQHIVKDDFYGRVGTPEGYVKALHELGGVFSSPVLAGKLLLFGSADGGLYALERG